MTIVRIEQLIGDGKSEQKLGCWESTVKAASSEAAAVIVCLGPPSLYHRKEPKMSVSMPNTAAIYEQQPLPCRCSCVRLIGEFLNVPFAV